MVKIFEINILQNIKINIKNIGNNPAITRLRCLKVYEKNCLEKSTSIYRKVLGKHIFWRPTFIGLTVIWKNIYK